VYYIISRVMAFDEVRNDEISPLRCLVEDALCVSPAGAEEAREHPVDIFLHCDAEELGIEVDLVLEDAVC
jgi:hypothetical protein